jgi:23S rRNA (uracil1939-C5)-methyltransferase
VKEEDVVLDAYCGVGTMSLLFAKKAAKVIGVEYVPEAIEDAKINATMNGLKNTSFHAALAEEFIGKVGKVDIVVLNPPRKGCEPAMIEKVGSMPLKKIVYVSCDPATLARDLRLLADKGWKVESVEPFDMFPQTAHVETLVSLTFCPH